MPPGRIKTGKTTMQDIADKLGISKVSVSKALAGHKGVSEELRRTIFQTAREMDYNQIVPDDKYNFAFIVSKRFFLETDAFYSAMFYYFSEGCLANGHNAVLIIVNSSDEEKCILPIQLEKERFHGFAVAGQMSDSYLKALASLQKPMVLMDFESSEVNSTVLLTDNYHWGFKVTQYLIDRGHKDIGFVGPVGSTNSITDRYFGYRKALLLNDLAFSPDWLFVNNDTRSGMYYSTVSLPAKMPTALVCHCDRAAYYMLESLSVRGLRCPQDVSIISFDNTRLAGLAHPGLTSVNIDTKVFSHQALKTLMSLQSTPNAEPQRLYIPARLFERESVVSLLNEQ